MQYYKFYFSLHHKISNPNSTAGNTKTNQKSSSNRLSIGNVESQNEKMMLQQVLYLLFIFPNCYSNFSKIVFGPLFNLSFFLLISTIVSLSPFLFFLLFSPVPSPLSSVEALGSCSWLPLPTHCSTLHPISISISLSKKPISTNPFLCHFIKTQPVPIVFQFSAWGFCVDLDLSLAWWFLRRSRPGLVVFALISISA